MPKRIIDEEEEELSEEEMDAETEEEDEYVKPVAKRAPMPPKKHPLPGQPSKVSPTKRYQAFHNKQPKE